MTLDTIFEEIKKAEKIVILTHESPDGDAVSSSLSVKVALKQLGKEADVIIPQCPKDFKFLPEANTIKEKSEITEYDLAISVDCSDLRRLVGSEEYFETAKTTIQIDHHSINAMFADLNYVDPVSPACCQILIGMFEYFGIEIDKELGTCLLTGILTDTGGFQYSAVSKETFEIAARLLSTGVNISKIYKKVFATHTKGNFELRKIALQRMEFLEDGKVAFSYITKEDEENVNAEDGDNEGIVNEGRNIEGVEVSIFLREIDEGMRVSMRSNDYVNVSDVCLMFGGGGHVHAAGATMQGTPEQIKEKLLKEVKLQLK